MLKLNLRLAIPVTLLGIALCLRMWGTLHGLPFGYHPDEEHILEPARAIAASGDLDPEWYRYPAATIYAQAVIQHAAEGVPNTAVTYPYVSERAWITRTVGRLFTAFLGVLAVVFSWRATAVLFDERSGWFALAVAATSPLHILHSHFITTDVPSSTFSAACLWAASRAWASRNEEGLSGARWLAGAAAFAGLAAATKYNAGLVVVAPVALGIAWRPRKTLQVVAMCGLVSLVAFLALMPWPALAPHAWWADFLFELNHYSAGQVGFSSEFGPWVFARAIVFRGLGVIGTLAAIGGVIAVLRRERALAALLLLFPALYFGLLSSMQMHVTRNLMPMLPFCWLLAGAGGGQLLLWLTHRTQRSSGAMVAAAAMLLVAEPTARSVLTTAEMAATDTRTEAYQWIVQYVPPTVRVCAEYYTPILPPTHQTWRAPSVCGGGEPTLRDGCDVVITASFVQEMLAEDAASYGHLLGCYDTITSEWLQMAQFEGVPIEIYNDPGISIWRSPAHELSAPPHHDNAANRRCFAAHRGLTIRRSSLMFPALN